MDKNEVAFDIFEKLVPVLDEIYFWSVFVGGLVCLILIARSLILSEPRDGRSVRNNKELEDLSPSDSRRYSTLLQQMVHSENLSWSRLSNFLIPNSILMLAWATVFASSNRSESVSVLIGVSFVGLLLSVAWAPFGSRGRRYFERYKQMVIGFEEEKMGDGPINEGDNQEGFHDFERLCRSWHLVILVPLAFAAVFYFLFLESVWLLSPLGGN